MTAGSPERPPARRRDAVLAASEASQSLIAMASDLPHPPRAQSLATSHSAGPDADALAPLADWLQRVQVDANGTVRPPHAPIRPRLIALSEPPSDERLTELIESANAAVHGRRLPSAAIDRGVETDLADAIAQSRQAVDDEVNGGTDLLLLVGDAAERAQCLAMLSLIGHIEPAALMSYTAAREDAEWIGELTAVRDMRSHAAAHRASVAHSLCVLDAPRLTAATALLLHAARRRTPALLDGLLPVTAAVIANALAPGATGWWQIAGAVWPPAQAGVLRALGLEPLCSLGAQAPAGAASVLALTMLRLGVAAHPGPGAGPAGS